MYMNVRFSTIIFVGLHVAEESDQKSLITVLKKDLKNVPHHMSKLLLILRKNGLEIVCSCLHTHKSHVHTHAKYYLQLKVHST